MNLMECFDLLVSQFIDFNFFQPNYKNQLFQLKDREIQINSIDCLFIQSQATNFFEMKAKQQEKLRQKGKEESQTKRLAKNQSPKKPQSYEEFYLLFHNRSNKKQKPQSHQYKQFVKYNEKSNQSYETDVEMQFQEHVKWEVEQPHQKLQVENSNKNEGIKQYHYQEDIVFQSRSQQQDQERKRKEKLLKSDNEGDLNRSKKNRYLPRTESQLSDQDISQLKQQPKPQSKQLSKAQIKHKQHVEQIFKTKFPQNVMHCVYPLDEKPFIITPINIKKQQSPKSFQQSFQIAINKEHNEQPLWTRAEHRILEVNMKWMALVIIDDKIRSLNQGKEKKDMLIFSIDFSQVPDGVKIKQKLLQLKCLLRYRNINNILSKLFQFIDECYEHDQLFGLNYIFDNQDFLLMLNIQLLDFYQMVMSEFFRLMIEFTGQYKQASRQNKQLVERMFYNEMGEREKAIRKQNDVKCMLNQQGVFKLWEEMLNNQCYNQQSRNNYKQWLKQKEQIRNQNKNYQDVQI